MLKTLTVRADKDLLDEFKKLCASNDKKQSQEVRSFMRSYVKKHQKKDINNAQT